GHTPLHATGDQPERPALVYVSEVSHRLGERLFCYGGGLYARGRIRAALVARDPDQALARGPLAALPRPAEAIDYYGELRAPGGAGSTCGSATPTCSWAPRPSSWTSGAACWCSSIPTAGTTPGACRAASWAKASRSTGGCGARCARRPAWRSRSGRRWRCRST